MRPLLRTLPGPAPAPAVPPVEVVLFGLGAIGIEVARAARARTGLRVVGAVDVDPAKVGRDLGEVCGEAPWGVPVRADLGDLAGARVAVHTTGSFLPDVAPQLLALLERGLRVVSSAEELAFPGLRHPDLAARLDRAARDAGTALVGVGVNPGFAMDALPLVLTTCCRSVRQVRVRRVVDTSRRRLNLQKKTGAGMTPAEFAAEMEGGRMGHIGLAESAALLACGLGFAVTGIEDELAPIVTDYRRQSEFLTVEAGLVVGLHQFARAKAGPDTAVELELIMALGGVADEDSVQVTGDPDLALAIPGGLPGDVATVATLLNTVPRIVGATGLCTVLDLPLPHAAR
ncbi:MAG: dihydrodipicolinate reductase [Candidatus Sericytochromatia bacterium]|nr:dihydrodipicolinate reductase [Candidatus Tanganyikabacteria bacterium]